MCTILKLLKYFHLITALSLSFFMFLLQVVNDDGSVSFMVMHLSHNMVIAVSVGLNDSYQLCSTLARYVILASKPVHQPSIPFC